MDANFRTLGLTRSASLEDVRRAYKQKALQLHPDRNPGGADLFKRVQEAYEAVMKHLRNGRPDGDFIDAYIFAGDSGGNRAGASAFRSAPRQAAPASTPLFSEEELFRNINTDFGDFGAQRGCGPAASRRPFRQRDTPPLGTTAGRGNAATWSSSSATSAGLGSGLQDSEEKIARDRAAASRAAATGTRTAVPGYEPTCADQRNAARFQQTEDGLRRRSASGSDSPSPPPPPPRGHNSTAGGGSGSGPASPAKEGTSGGSPPLGRRAATMYVQCRTRAELQQEWEEARERMQVEQQLAEQRRAMEAAARRSELERATREEWERTQREMDSAREERVLEASIADAHLRVEQERAADESLRELASQRRQVRREALANVMPSKSAIEKMSEQELYLFDQVLRVTREQVAQEISHRRFQPCVSCNAAKRLTKRPTVTSPSKGSDARNLFKCEHESVCLTCLKTSVAGCPICGAERY